MNSDVLIVSESKEEGLREVHNIAPRYRSDIDGLRGFAILSVVLFHAFPTVLRGGFVGVDIFFVISGFLISSIIFMSLQRNDFSFMEFYEHRIRRIFPALIIVLFSSCVVGRYVLLPDELKLLSKHIISGAGFVQNFILWKEHGYFDSASESKPLLHLWSLAIEEQYYLIYPLAIVVAWRLRFNVLHLVLGLCVCSFALNIHNIKIDPVGTFYLPQTRFWELFAGAALAYVHTIRHGLPREPFDQQLQQYRNVISLSGFILLVASVCTIEEGTGFPGWWAIMPVIGTVLVILAGPQSVMNRWVLANRAMVFVGLISYPLYLWHWPILSFLSIVETESPVSSILAGALLLSFGLAWLTYVYIEKPIRYGRSSWGKMALLSAALVALAIAGQYTRLSLKHLDSFAGSGSRADTYCAAQFNPTGDLCRVVIKVPPTTLILGDSHAHLVFLGLEEKQLNGMLVGNAMLLGQTACPYPSPEGSMCAKRFETVFDIIKTTKSIETIVLASVTIRHYIEHHRFDGISSPYEAWEGVLDRALMRFDQMGKKVVIVIDNPLLSFDPKQCNVRRFRITEKNLRQDCSIAAREYFDMEKNYRNAVFNAAKNYPNVKVLDSAMVFCDTNRCSALRDDHMLYSDNNHLSVHGTRLLVEELARMIREQGKMSRVFSHHHPEQVFGTFSE